MHNKLVLVIIALMISAALLINCAGPVVFNSKSLKEIALSAEVDKQLNPVNPGVKFTTAPTQIFCSFLPSPGMSVTAEWIYMKGELKDSNYTIDSWTELVKKEGRIAMLMRRFASGWARGIYQVNLSVNGVQEISIPFEIN